jgi:transcriptional regulator with XRE-family HTH domain
MSDQTNLQKLLQPRGSGARLGRAINVSDQNIWAWRKGVAKPSQGILQVIAEHFNVSIEYLRTCVHGLTSIPKSIKITT